MWHCAEECICDNRSIKCYYCINTIAQEREGKEYSELEETHRDHVLK